MRPKCGSQFLVDENKFDPNIKFISKCGSQFKIKYEIIDPPVSNYLNINISNIAIPEISDTAELKNKEF